jgi:hypothetical protein
MNKVKKLHPENGESDYFVSQLAVQGIRKDEFKYVALGLLTASPYVQDWTEYFYEADWGKVGPLIHDGGNVVRSINPNYANRYGRTDFILRIGKVWESDFDEIEKMEPEQITGLSQEELDNLLQEQRERERLLTETKAYQRLALAYDCAYYEASPQLTDYERELLAKEWDGYVAGIQNLFEEYQIGEVFDVKWFRNKPRSLGRWHNRHEGKWKPIKKSLIRLDEVRATNPEMVARAYYLLKNKVVSIDAILAGIGKRKADEFYQDTDPVDEALVGQEDKD